MVDYRSHIANVRHLAQQRLTRLENCDDIAQQSFLFQNGSFVGIRFRLGGHFSDWIFSDASLKFFGQGQPVSEHVVPLGETSPTTLAPPVVFPIAPFPSVTLTDAKVTATSESQKKAA